MKTILFFFTAVFVSASVFSQQKDRVAQPEKEVMGEPVQNKEQPSVIPSASDTKIVDDASRNEFKTSPGEKGNKKTNIAEQKSNVETPSERIVDDAPRNEFKMDVKPQSNFDKKHTGYSTQSKTNKEPGKKIKGRKRNSKKEGQKR